MIPLDHFVSLQGEVDQGIHGDIPAPDPRRPVQAVVLWKDMFQGALPQFAMFLIIAYLVEALFEHDIDAAEVLLGCLRGKM